MIHSLRARLLLAVGCVVAVAIAGVGLFSSRMTRLEFEQFLELEYVQQGLDELPIAQLEEALGRHLEERGSWAGVDTLLDRLLAGHAAIGALYLVGSDDQILGWAENRPGQARMLPGDRLEITFARPDAAGDQADIVLLQTPQVILGDPNGPIAGRLFVFPEMPLPGNEHGVRFLASTNRWLLVAVIAAGGVALLLTGLATRRILAPVEALTAAARGMSAGDLSRRVQIRTQDEIGRLGEAFNAMADGLERTETLRRRMVSDVAHELRTPLTNVRCQIEALQDGLQQPTPALIDSIHDEVMHLGHLVADLEELALAESGELRMERQPFAVSAELERVIGALPAAGTTPRAEITVDLEKLPAALGDPIRFRQIVTNLLSNALAHTPADGRVEIHGRAAGGEIEMSICDTGPGIAPEDLPNVFERFYRADRSRTRGSGGAGLGLAIVRQLVTRMGGRVWVDSRPGEGARFRFTVPVAANS